IWKQVAWGVTRGGTSDASRLRLRSAWHKLTSHEEGGSMSHRHAHAFTHFNALQREGLTLASRRNFLKAGLAGVAGLTLPALLQARESGRAKPRKSLILLW